VATCVEAVGIVFAGFRNKGNVGLHLVPRKRRYIQVAC